MDSDTLTIHGTAIPQVVTALCLCVFLTACPEPDGDADADADVTSDADVASDADLPSDSDLDATEDAEPEADVLSDGDVDPDPDEEEFEPFGPEGDLCINEFMAANGLTLNDETGVPGDWIEIANPTDTPIELDGYGITDDLSEPFKHTFSGGLVVPAHGYLVVWADDSPEVGRSHLRFRLDEAGESLALVRPDGRFIDRLTFGAQEGDFSAARQPDCSTEWVVTWHPTPRDANAEGAGTPRPHDDPEQEPAAVPAAGDVSQQLFEEGIVLEIDINLPPDSYATLAALRSASPEFVEGSITFRGRTFGPIGVRLKGQNSFLPLSRKAAFLLNFNAFVDGVEFFDLSGLTLNNMMDDQTMLHDHMAYFTARHNDLVASRQSYAVVRVNGELYGLYSMLESVGRRMMGRWFEDDSGPLFEAWDVRMIREHVPMFEHEAGPDDRTLLYGIADALALFSPGGQPASEALAAVAEVANLDQFRLYWAVGGYVGQFDGMPYSMGDDYLLYAEPTTNQLHFIPWGMDETFEARARRLDSVRGLLAQACLADPDCRQAWIDRLYEVSDASSETVLAEFDRTVEMITPYATEDPRKPYNLAQMAAQQANMRLFIEFRGDEIRNQFPPPPDP